MLCTLTINFVKGETVLGDSQVEALKRVTHWTTPKSETLLILMGWAATLKTTPSQVPSGPWWVPARTQKSSGPQPYDLRTESCQHPAGAGARVLLWWASCPDSSSSAVCESPSSRHTSGKGKHVGEARTGSLVLLTAQPTFVSLSFTACKYQQVVIISNIYICKINSKVPKATDPQHLLAVVLRVSGRVSCRKSHCSERGTSSHNAQTFLDNFRDRVSVKTTLVFISRK